MLSLTQLNFLSGQSYYATSKAHKFMYHTLREVLYWQCFCHIHCKLNLYVLTLGYPYVKRLYFTSFTSSILLALARFQLIKQLTLMGLMQIFHRFGLKLKTVKIYTTNIKILNWNFLNTCILRMVNRYVFPRYMKQLVINNK